MFGSSALETAIGVMFIYLLLSLICSVLNEAIATLIEKRGNNLFKGIKNLLNDPEFTGLAQQLYTHGLVDSISQEATNPNKANRLPSYMASRTFALALLDILGSQGVAKSGQEVFDLKTEELAEAKAQLAANPTDAALQQLFAKAEVALKKAQKFLDQATKAQEAHEQASVAAKEVKSPKDFEKLRVASEKLGTALALGRVLAAEVPDQLANIQKAAQALPKGPTKESLLVLIDKTKRETALVSDQIKGAEYQIEALQANMEQWFNDTMDRVGGWYKRWTQKVVLVLSILLVLAANADTLMLAKRFLRDNALRASVTMAAEQAVRDEAADPTENLQARQDLLKAAESLNLPLGWLPAPNDPYATDQFPDSFPGWLMKLLGLLISVLAVSLGAPFWFDTLSKFINLRGAGTPPGELKKSAPQVGKS
jgi:hypothetical protein